MTTIKSLQREVEELKARATAAQDEAERLRELASDQSAKQDLQAAQTSTDAAAQKQHESVNTMAQAEQKNAQLADLKRHAEDIRKQIDAKQRELNNITG